MKKIYATILATILSCGAMMAQSEETSFQFTFDGTAVPNGGTVVIANYETPIEGYYTFEAPVNIKNISSDPCSLTLTAKGIENYSNELGMVSFCPSGNCRPWPESGEISVAYKSDIAAGANAESGSWLHAESYAIPWAATITLTAASSMDPDDTVTITVKFDTNGQQGIQSLKGVSVAPHPIEIYNLCGKKIGNSATGLAKGIYIIKCGDTSRKVVIR